MCGGHHGSLPVSVVTRFSFPFDSGTDIRVGNLSTSRYRLVPCNSSNYGYMSGGIYYDGTNAERFSYIERITFPFDSGIAAHVGYMTSGRDSLSSCNSSNYGYVCGGYSGVFYSTIDRITFPFDSGTATHVGNLSVTRKNESSFNSSNYGYVCAGEYNDGSHYHLSNIDRIAFPFDSGTATHVGNMLKLTYSHTSCNSSNYGYCCGGIEYPNYLSVIERVSFPFDSGTSVTIGNLTNVKDWISSCNSSRYGYISGGHHSDRYSTIDRITFPFDSGTATHVGNLSGTRCETSSTDGVDFVTMFV